MMQRPFLRRTRLAGQLDRLGLCCLTILLSIGFFFFLWRDMPCALPAGLALSFLLLTTFRLLEKRTLQAREAALRRKLGGEMAVDSLLLQSADSAVSNAAAWLSRALEDPLEETEPRPGGILARCGEETVWIACLQKHPDSAAGTDDVISVLRSARREKVQACVICATCAFSPKAAAFCEEILPRTLLLGRPVLCALAGNAVPATDEQLRLLGRRRRRFRLTLWKKRILAPEKKKRYALYGLVLLLFYFLFKATVYLLPAAVCLFLFLLCLGKGKKKWRI